MSKTTNKVAKVAKVAKSVKADKPAREPKVLNTPQTWILRILNTLKKGSLTRSEIAEKAGKQGCSTSNGRISDEAGNYGYLVEKKFVKEYEMTADETGARAETRYEITAAGKTALKEHGVAKKK